MEAYRSERVVLPDGARPATVMVEAGRIAAVLPFSEGGAARELGRLALLPGLIDPHVHINAPGRTEWEGFETATRAAAAGGFTTLIDMPLNNLPETTTVAALELKRAEATGKSHVDLRFWGGATNANIDSLSALAEAGVPGFKSFLIDPGCAGLGLIDEVHLREAMPAIASTGLPLLVHAELAGPLNHAAASLPEEWLQYSLYLASRPPEAELVAIAQMIRLCREFGTRVHIVHVSAAEALPLIAAARAEGLPVTAETCPHYLYFASEEIGDGATELKCAPPIRSAANRQRLLAGLRDGTLDLVASDHSPCPPAMKNLPALGGTGDFRTAWGGIASLSPSASALWTAMGPEAQLSDLVQWMAAAPAALAGVSASKGCIAVGMDADLTVFDPEAEFTVTEERLHFRHKVSPYLGRKLRGVVRETILRGTTIFANGKFTPEPLGREVRI